MANQAQVSGPSKGNAGGISGGVNPLPPFTPNPSPNPSPQFTPPSSEPAEPTATLSPKPASNPSPEPASNLSPKGVSERVNPNQQIQQVNINFNPVSTSPNVTVTTGADGDVTMTITPAAQQSINQAFTDLLTELASPGGNTKIGDLMGAGSNVQPAITELTESMNSTGVSPELTRGLLESLASLLSPLKSYIKPTYHTAQLTESDLLTNTKALKASFTIAQVNATASVDINKLSVAINVYNTIVNQSSPKVLLGLSQNKDFVEIGRVLKKLRAAIG
ncbi:hypothetical protein [Aphanizomenon sp. CS-733/32]|uniref:hypothetical protein n=1 Tax=Aphanizomenon sp. CS-733/32 TaxID=3021715 RepID=UPI00232F9103|nr:hypothetical protein [Aphanizomenon sp. CS-733/32]